MNWKTLSEANHQIIRSWIIELLENQGMEAVSVNRKISTLRAFYGYLLKLELIEEDPTTKITAPKARKTLPEFADVKSMIQLFESDTYFSDGYKGVLERAILSLFYQTGMRLSELITLDKRNVDWGRNLIKVLGKRNKERFIPLNNETADELLSYKGLRDAEFPNDNSKSFFLTDKGKPLSTSYVYRLVNRVLKKVTTLHKTSPHVVRHTFATHMLNAGADLNTIKEILGHSSLAATQVYTHNSFEQLKLIYNQAHPRA